ncbi:MAG: nucleotidyltransferase domain-containing protein [Candidatus Pacearchaeota archaeon]|jgi:predicted nucleotidyltransferase|nr:nucleotidyltransferase domain-containing protein [Candidatus Pacearchaeota archaeon]
MLLNENTFKILAEFCSDYSKRIYGGQVAKKLKMNQKTVSNILNALEKQNIVKYFTEGKNKYYFLNKLSPQIADIIKILEIERKNNFIAKYPKFKELFIALEKRTKGVLIIFGSYANFTSNEKSDLDVFVMGNLKGKEDLEEKYNLIINIVKSSKENFNKEEIFIKEIIKNHIILKGVEEFIELIWQ